MNIKYSCSILLAFLCVETVHGYEDGAPLEACAGMAPGHGVLAQTDPSPYTITTSSSTYTCKQDITVTLSGTTAFKGFQCQIRTDVDSYQTYGTLLSTGSVPTTNNCGSDKAVITHKTNANKNGMSFTWKPYVTNETSVYVVCTVVKEYTTFWVKQQSTAITYVEGGDCTPDDDTRDSTNHIAASSLVLLIGFVICLLV